MSFLKTFFNFRFINNSMYLKIAFILWSLIHSITLGQYITSYISPLLIVWGGLIVIKNIFIDKPRFDKKYYLLIVMFIFSYIITIFINRNMNFWGNLKTLIWTSILMLGLFINDFKKSIEDIFNEISKIGLVIITISLIISLISIWMFFFDINFLINRIDGTKIPQGYYAARLWGIYVDPNQSCNVAIISIALSLVLLLLKINRFVLIFNIVVQFELIVLSGSRGGEIGLIFFLIGLFYLFFEEKINKIYQNKIVIRNLSLIFAVICSILIIMTFKINRKILSYVPSTVQSSIEGTVSQKIIVERPDKKTSNGRIELWIDALNLSKQIPIFGVGDRNIMIVADEKLPGSSISHQYVHNGYLHMLLGGGIVGFTIMMALILLIVIRTSSKIFNKRVFNKEYIILGIIASMIGAMLVTTVFLTEVFYQNSFTAIIIWIFMGYTIYLNENVSIK